MNENIKFDFGKSFVPDDFALKYKKKIEEEIEALNCVLSCGYEDDRASIGLVSDKSIVASCQKLVDKVCDADVIVIVGIGGSNLGTIAVYEALKGKLHNELCNKRVYFADTVDSGSVCDICEVVRKELLAGGKVCLNAISKSGGTTETVANFDVLLSVLKDNAKYDYEDYVVVTTGVGSRFEKFAKKNGFSVLNLPDKVGGRFSVFSSVGVFSLLFLGVDVSKLFLGACDMREKCLSCDFDSNPALKSAVSIFYHSLEGRNVFDTFLFSSQLESVGKWYRQLLGESIGKEFDVSGKKVNCGVTPLVSIGSTDLHSMAQLFLGGPDDKFHCIVDVLNVSDNSDVSVSCDSGLGEIVPDVCSKKLSDIMKAILKGVKGAFDARSVPFYEISLPKIDEYNIGAFLQMKMIEMMILGKLFNVNPFDQPNVEEYKVVTKKFLGMEN